MLSTHSPWLIDLFGADLQESVLLVEQEPGKSGSGHSSTYSKGGFTKRLPLTNRSAISGRPVFMRVSDVPIRVGLLTEGHDHLIFQAYLAKLLGLREEELEPDVIDGTGHGWQFVEGASIEPYADFMANVRSLRLSRWTMTADWISSLSEAMRIRDILGTGSTPDRGRPGVPVVLVTLGRGENSARAQLAARQTG